MWSMAANKGGRAFITTVESYIRDGWALTIVTTGGGVPDSVRAKAIILEQKFPHVDKLNSSKIRLIRVIGKYISQYVRNRFYYKSGTSILSNSRDNVVLYAYEVAGVKAAKALSQKYGLPLVTRFQGTIIANVKNTFINRLRYYPHFSALSTRADLIIMTNDGTQGLKALKNLGNTSKVDFWMNGVTIPQLPSCQGVARLRSNLGFDGKFVFLTVSRLVAWKKVERAISAFASVYKDIPGAFLHIIGDGTSRPFLEDYATNAGVSQRVVFHGAIEQSKVFDYMVASNVFLSLYDLSNVGNPLLEAMSCGKPIITLDNGDTSMFIKNMENGVILKMDEIDKVSEWMYRLYSDRNLAESIGASARKYSENNFWSWEDRMKHEIQDVKLLLNAHDRI